MALTALLDLFLSFVTSQSNVRTYQDDFQVEQLDDLDEIKFVPISANLITRESDNEPEPLNARPLSIEVDSSLATKRKASAAPAPAQSPLRGPRVKCSGMRPPRIPKCAVSPTVVCKGVCEEYGDECVECDLRKAARMPRSPCSVVNAGTVL
mmetsp:Transcript_12698/g.33593  ORF Transcript_12698/g.33593 Transcript_12698/m.33593 type:complete len:152 (+) Transcript_12698:1-456(+)